MHRFTSDDVRATQWLRPQSWKSWEAVRPALFGINRFLLRHRPLPAAHIRVSAYCVWRVKNQAAIRRIVAELGSETAIHLHCLDTDPLDGDLGRLTDSQGPGDRIPLLAALMSRFPPRPGDWVLIMDDDAYFHPKDWLRFTGIAETAGFDICQPAHDHESHYSHPMTRARFLSIARRTRFVEVGPIVLLSPAAIRRCLPFPPDLRMGWGLDVLWWSLGRQELSLGIVDATPIVHTGSVGNAYSRGYETSILEQYLERFNVQELRDIVTETGESWRYWQRLPPWVAS